MTNEKQIRSSNPSGNRTYEGPARILTPNIDLTSLQDGRGLLESPEERNTRMYGARGVGWDFITDRHDEENGLTAELNRPEFTVATEGLKNFLSGNGYRTDDGIDLTGKMRRYAATPPMGDVVVYPDGDVHYSQQNVETYQIPSAESQHASVDEHFVQLGNAMIPEEYAHVHSELKAQYPTGIAEYRMDDKGKESVVFLVPRAHLDDDTKRNFG